jgi:hypothetical protein
MFIAAVENTTQARSAMFHIAPTEIDRICRCSFYKHFAPTALACRNSHTPTLPHSLTPSLPHSHTPSLPHSHTPTLPHSHTPTLFPHP